MNILLNRHLSRRTLLNGTGISLTLSFLDAIRPVFGAAAAMAKPRNIILASSLHARGADIVFPADANIRDVKSEFGAKGNGTTDDTAAIQKAFDSCQQKHMEVVYFPIGTYLVSKPVHFRGWMFVQGENRDKTIIKLQDKCPGYGDVKTPNWLLATTDPMLPEKRPGGDNMAFSNHVMNLTLDVGTGNPAAIGVQFISHNGGGLEDVTIRSADAGLIGLDLRTPWNGPCLFQRVRIEGFGRLFADDLCGAPLLFEYPQKVWLRGLNCEMGQGLKIDNRAADLWIMGYKAEGVATELRNGKLARTELLGGLLYPAGGDLEKNPSFINDGGQLSLVHSMFWANRQYIHDTWKGTTKKHRTEERFMHLYVTNPEE